MTAVAAEVSCPKCGGEMWDNRLKKTNPKAPDFKCKDKSCEGVIWPPKNRGPQRVEIPARQEVPNEPESEATLGDLFTVYDVCMGHAIKVAAQCKAKHDLGFTAEGVAAIAATLVIAAQKKGLV